MAKKKKISRQVGKVQQDVGSKRKDVNEVSGMRKEERPYSSSSFTYPRLVLTPFLLLENLIEFMDLDLATS